MEKSSIIDKIKSKYITEIIFDYIKDKTFKYKLFFYSKLFRRKFNLNLDQYIYYYIEKLNIFNESFL